jgi:transcriptional regulator with XRE-family HTH domain
MESTGDKISQTRKSKGLTQERLAELAKINLRTLRSGFPTGFSTGLLNCLVIALAVLFYGNIITKLIE